MNFLKNKKFKYGSAAVVLTVVVLAVVLVMNVIISTLSDHFRWYVDTSSSGLFHFSEQSLAMMDQIDGTNNKITIYYFSDENTLSASQYGRYVLALTDELSNRYDFVSVSHIDDINKDVLEIDAIFGTKYDREFREMYENGEIQNGTMIIRNDTYEMSENGQFVTDPQGNKRSDYRITVFSITDLYSESGSSFLYDYILTGYMVNICNLSPTAYFITGHGEMTTQEDDTYGNAEYLVKLFKTCGFTIKKINLSQMDFETTIVEPSIAVIFAPKNDYTTVELDRLSRFIQGGGNLMMFADSVYYKLDQLNALLSEYGISIAPAKFKSGLDASLGAKDFSFAATRNGESAIMEKITDQSSRVAVNDCRVLRVDTAKGAVPVLLAPESATLSGSETELLGNEAVAAYSHTEGQGSVFVAGAASLASSLVYTPSYGNRDVVLSVLDEMGAEGVPLNIEIKNLATNGLDLTRSQAITLTVVLSAIPALLIVAVGTFVYIRRKRS